VQHGASNGEGSDPFGVRPRFFEPDLTYVRSIQTLLTCVYSSSA
jgi:hypothetical protein